MEFTDTIAVGIILTGAIIFILLLMGIRAPYGRYAKGSSSLLGCHINSKAAWIIQECPTLLMFFLLFLLGHSSQVRGIVRQMMRPDDGNYPARVTSTGQLVNVILLCMFVVHYMHRTFIFPMLIRGGKSTPCIVCLLAFLFCSVNGFLQCEYLMNVAVYDPSWLYSVRFICGVILFILGGIINIHSDYILRNLRKPGEIGYKIPQGGMFTYVSGANYFGEIVEWFGYALAGWSLPALAFAVFTFCNTAPRGVHHHADYLQKFDNYPRRHAIIPFVW